MSPILIKENNYNGIYRLSSDKFLNTYYIVSDANTRRLMASPEVVGFETYTSMLRPTSSALKMLIDKGVVSRDGVDILTILRGGLNYPIEECCYQCGIQVNNIDFVSCERIIKNHCIENLEVKYEKLCVKANTTVILGDIIASGDTIRLCMRHVIDYFKANGGSIKKIVFFTIGGTKAISIMESFTDEIKGFWPDFEGFFCVFYEGVFTVYEDKGVTGVNVPNIDFGLKGGVISPDFREYLVDYDYCPALLEKCIIYDGGARRYEIGAHYEEVMDYWKSLYKVSGNVDFDAFVAEKIGYRDISFSQWIELNGYEYDESYLPLYEKEIAYANELKKKDLPSICERRIRQVEEKLGKYSNN
ncbi:MAG: hypothetical protein ACI358_04275 [Candidatus Limimorpha sp.]